MGERIERGVQMEKKGITHEVGKRAKERKQKEK